MLQAAAELDAATRLQMYRDIEATTSLIARWCYRCSGTAVAHSTRSRSGYMASRYPEMAGPASRMLWIDTSHPAYLQTILWISP